MTQKKSTASSQQEKSRRKKKGVWQNYNVETLPEFSDEQLEFIAKNALSAGQWKRKKKVSK